MGVISVPPDLHKMLCDFTLALSFTLNTLLTPPPLSLLKCHLLQEPFPDSGSVFFENF